MTSLAETSTHGQLVSGDTRQAVGKIRRTRMGIHWFDRQSGLNLLLDDVSVPEERCHRSPRYVSVALTNACDLRCSYCYAPKSSAHLEEERLLRWARELDNDGCLGIGLGGGEPTLHRDFARICRRLANETHAAVTLTTHGHRLDERLADELRGNVHFLRVSIDGIGVTYEQLRGRSFAALEGILQLARSICPFGVNVVVNSSTVGELDELTNFAERAGAVELLLLPQQRTPSTGAIDNKTSEAMRMWIATTDTRMRLAISRNGASGLPSLADPFPDEEPLEAHAHIDATGAVMPDAYARCRVPIGDSVLAALDELRAGQQK